MEDFIQEDYDNHSPAQDIDFYVIDQPSPRNNSDTNPADEHGNRIIELCKTFRMRILNGRTSGDRWGAPTRFPIHRREKPSLIDYGISSTSLLPAIQSFYVLPSTTISDHCCISARITVDCDAHETDMSENADDKPNIILRPGFQLAKVGTYQTNLNEDPGFETLFLQIQARLAEKNSSITQDEVDNWTNMLSSTIHDNAKKSFTCQDSHPKSDKKKAKPAKWYSRECRNARNSLKRAINCLNRNPFNTSCQEKAVSARKKYKKICKEAEANHRKDLLDKLLHADDPKEFWRMMKNMQGWGRETEDPSSCISPKTWEEYFTTLLNTPQDKGLEPPTKKKTSNDPEGKCGKEVGKRTPKTPNHPLLEAKITLKELVEAISKMKYGKAVGPDGILTEYLKFATTNVVKILLQLMNIIFSKAIYPSAWTDNFLKAIYKSGPTDDPGNYRGLAIGSTMAKLYSTVLLNRLEEIITERGTLSKNQIGFIKGHRTADHIYVLKTLITKYTKNKGRLYAAFIDFRKAYDTVNRELLLKNLEEYDIRGKLWNNIKSIYNLVKYTIKIGNRAMNPITSNLGLKQGCPLSPLLFNLYINDISEQLKPTSEDSIMLQNEKITHFMYADDLIIVASSKELLQDKLNSLSNFAEMKDLTINTKKSQVMVFNQTGKLLKKDTFTINKKELEVVPKYTYLGVDMPSSGSFSTSVGELTSKAKKAMMPLFTTIMQFNIPFRKGLQLFQSYIEPILLYNAENQATMTDGQIEKCKQDSTHIYTLCNESPLTTTQLKFTKFILGVGKHCPNMAIFGESASLPLLTRAHIHMLKFWDRIRNMDQNTLVNLAYRENVLMNTNWCKTIQVLNAAYNLHSRQYEPKDFPALVKKEIKSDFIQYWKSRISNREIEKKLHLYSKFKNNFEIEPYTELPFKDRQIISKMLCVSHKLNVETSRHHGIPREKRKNICSLCTLRKVEDEVHFMAECPAYEKIRHEHFGSKTFNNIEDMISQRDPATLASFLRKSYTTRDQLLEEPTETYHVASKNGLKLVIRKGQKINKTCNVEKDGLKIRILNIAPSKC